MGEEVETVRLVGDALVEAIKRKLVEGSFEVSDAKTADSIAEELADVQEVIDRSEEHTSELQSLMRISYAVFCLKKNKQDNRHRVLHIEIASIRSQFTNIQ